MTLSAKERALLVKLYYKNSDCAVTALRKYRTLRGLKKGGGPISVRAMEAMIKKFEETGSFDVRRGRGRKPIPSASVEDVALSLEEGRNTQGTTSARGIARSLHMPLSTVLKILRSILKCYPYKITHVQQLLNTDFAQRETFALQFIARMDVDVAWPWNILWTDEAHFHLNGVVNTQNCRIWAKANPMGMHALPLHSPKVTVWCGFTSSFIIGPFFFEELRPGGPVTVSVNATRYKSLLENDVIPALQQRQCLDRTIFMQDGATPHIASSVKEVLQRRFGNDRIISRHFPTPWPPRSPDITPCDFWLWGFLKNVVYSAPLDTLADLKCRITQHVHNISTDTLQAAVENTVLRLHLLTENGGHHIENFLKKTTNN